jgi:hypothetical protein
MVSPMCLSPSFLSWCYNMASTLFPSLHLTSYFLQLSLLPGSLGSLQDIILVRGVQHGVPYVPLPFISFLVLQHGVHSVPILLSYLVFSSTVSPPWLPWFSPRNHPCERGATWRPLCASSLHFLPGAKHDMASALFLSSNLPRIFSSCLSSLAALVLSKKSSL